MGRGCRTLPGPGDEGGWDVTVGGSKYKAAEQEHDQREAGVEGMLGLTVRL